MTEKLPTRTEILDLVQAQAETAQNLSERLVEIERLVEKQESRNDKQESRNQNGFYAVIFAFLIIVITVAVQVLLSTKHDDSVYGGIYNKVIDVQTNESNLQDQFDVLKAKNPYLK